MIDPQRLVSLPPQETRQTISARETILYALGVGETALPFVYEDGLKMLPTMAVTLAYPGFVWRDPAYGADWAKILHGETGITIHAPLPAHGEFVGLSTFDSVADKGAAKGAIVRQTRRIYDGAGMLLATVRNASFLRGDGGCGSVGEPGNAPAPVPDRAPDLSLDLPTLPSQALIYRLSGDLNPLHIDPAVATGAGFPRPILHGLCTYGIAGRALLAALCEGDPARLRRMGARFTSPVFPGETIRTEIWREGGRIAFRARVVERDLVVLDNGLAEIA